MKKNAYLTVGVFPWEKTVCAFGWSGAHWSFPTIFMLALLARTGGVFLLNTVEVAARGVCQRAQLLDQTKRKLFDKPQKEGIDLKCTQQLDKHRFHIHILLLSGMP